MATKQVIVMRKFPSLRTGKYCAQASHASVGAVFSIGKIEGNNLVIPLNNPFVNEWVTTNFKKVVCYVDTEAELVELYKQAMNAGIASSLIKDAGLTEFDGVATLTAVGIGPDDAEKIDKITGHLKLF